LVAVGLLRGPGYLDASLEHAARPAGEHVLDGLARFAARCDMAHDGGEVGVLDAGKQLRTVQVRGCAWAGKIDTQFGSGKLAAKVQGKAVVGAAIGHPRIDGRDMEGVVCL